ncbi:hypothetical protein FQR65_LT18644 [Abscondita terminalis]|nr:hypothetical protein FQR65_LT18644 [Abscondita terminalis]
MTNQHGYRIGGRFEFPRWRSNMATELVVDLNYTLRHDMVKIIKRRELKLLHPILDTRRKTRGFASEFWIPEGRREVLHPSFGYQKEDFGLRHRTRRRFEKLVVQPLCDS